MTTASFAEFAGNQSEHFPWGAVSIVAASEGKMGETLMHWALSWEHGAEKYLPRSLSPYAAEVFGARFMHHLGIGAPTRIVSSSEEDSATWIAKSLQGDRLKAAKDGDAHILIEKISDAISLFSLREIYGIESNPSRWNFPPSLGVWDKHVSDFFTGYTGRPSGTHKMQAENIREFLQLGRQKLSNASEFFGDFHLPADTRAIRAAVQWDSPQKLAIDAARFFLGCTTAHVGNLLVDADAKLYSIDHESCAFLDPTSLDVLFGNVRRGTKAFSALEGVASLSENDALKMFDDLPPVEWPLGSKEQTTDYFLARLCRWKALYQLANQSIEKPKAIASYKTPYNSLTIV